MFSSHLCILPQGQTTKIKPFPLMNLLPKHNMSQYYRYYGSLTTPPCSQVVVWTLYEVPVYISWSQVGLLSLILKNKHLNGFLSAVSYPLSFLLSWLSLPHRSSPQRRMQSRWRLCRETSDTSTPPSDAKCPCPKMPNSSRGRPGFPSAQLCLCFKSFCWEASSSLDSNAT